MNLLRLLHRPKQEMGPRECEEIEDDPQPPNVIPGFYYQRLDVSDIDVADIDWPFSGTRGRRCVNLNVILTPHTLNLAFLCPTPQALMLQEMEPKKLEFMIEATMGGFIEVSEVFIEQHAPQPEVNRCRIITNLVTLERSRSLVTVGWPQGGE